MSVLKSAIADLQVKYDQILAAIAIIMLLVMAISFFMDDLLVKLKHGSISPAHLFGNHTHQFNPARQTIQGR
jgi:hypothetical protein